MVVRQCCDSNPSLRFSLSNNSYQMRSVEPYILWSQTTDRDIKATEVLRYDSGVTLGGLGS